MTELELIRWGVVPYGQALAYQQKARQQLMDDPEAPGQVIVLQHSPTVTLGKRGTQDHLVNPAFLKSKGVEVFTIDRGGEATYHGPGQLVIYPIVRLEKLGLGVVDLVRGLANCLADVVREDYGMECEYDTDHPGVWSVDAPRRKVASVGMRISRGISTHGAAINLVNDMAPFSWIIPCGIPDAPMMNLAEVADVDFEEFTAKFLARFAEFLGARFVEVTPTLPVEADWVSAD